MQKLPDLRQCPRNSGAKDWDALTRAYLKRCLAIVMDVA